MMLTAFHWFIGFLGGTVGLAIIAAVGWLLKLGVEKALGHFFETKLTEFKHEQAREIEQLKNALNYVGDRGIRSNELEYQALITVWEGFIDAYNATFGAIGGFRQSPDLNHMTDDQVNTWLETTSFSPPNKEFIRTATDKLTALGRVERAQELNDCQKAIWNAQQALRHKAVFIPAEIEEQFDQALITLRGVWAENKVSADHPGSVQINKTIEFTESEEGKNGIRAKLRDTVRNRVFHDLVRPNIKLRTGV